MPDDGISISGGGSVAVWTDGMLDASARLRSIERELATCTRELMVIEGATSAAPPSTTRAVERALADAAVHLRHAQGMSGTLHLALDRAADAYGFGERAVREVTEGVAAQEGYLLGFAIPVIATGLLPLLAGAGVLNVVLTDKQKSGLVTAVKGWAKTEADRHKGLLNSPAFANLVRLAVTSVDDVGAGLFRIPPGLDQALDRAGIGGVPLSAAVIVGIASRFGLFTESPVTVTQTTGAGLSAPTAPTSWLDRASRVPTKEEGGSQVRIDRYSVPGQPDRFEVYIGGTRTFQPGNDTEPLDLTSNMVAIAGGESGAMRVVEDAMRQAGIDSSSPVLFTGHSQGGLVAARLAASGDYNAQGLYTLGAPAEQVALPATVPWVAIEHTNDIVPPLSGWQTHSDPVLVTREYAAPPGSAIAATSFPSHQLPAYESTAALLDRSSDPRVAAAEKQFDDFLSGASPVATTTWQGVRDK